MATPPALGPPTRRRRRAPEARRVILDAAQKRLTEGGPEAVRLQDVARDVGISHPAVLHHFGSREGLLQALEQRAMANLQADLLAARNSDHALERVATTLGEQGHARLLAWWALRGGPEAASEPHEHMLSELADALAAEEPGGSREDIEFSIRLIAAAMLGEALLGPTLSRSAGLPQDEASPRFRRRLAALATTLMSGR